MQYTIPTSRELFKIGVSESPGPWDYITAQTAAALNDPLAARFGCYDNTTLTVDISCLRAVPLTSIYNYTWAALQPVYDNLIPRPIPQLFGDKAAMKKAKGGNPIILGSAKYEGNQFAFLALQILSGGAIPELKATFEQFFGILQLTIPTLSSAQLQQVVAYYSNYSVNGDYYVALREALGDYGINCGISRTLTNSLVGLRSKVYNYYFTHNTQAWTYDFLNATHTVDVPYVLLSNGTLSNAQFTSAEKKMARRIVKYIGNFQDTLNPNKEKRKNPSLPEVNIKSWPTLKKAKKSTLSWDLDFKVIKRILPASCDALWNNILIDIPATPRSSSQDPSHKFIDPEVKKFGSIFQG
jgi:carboxylesterase type B